MFSFVRNKNNSRILFSKPRQFHCKILMLSIFKVLLAARLNHVCVNSLHQVCFPNIIVNFLTNIFSLNTLEALLLTMLIISLKDIVLKLFLILMRTSATRTKIFVVVNGWVFWVSSLEMALEYFVSCFCLFASVKAFWYAGQPLYTVACEPPQFAHLACSFDSLQLFTVCLPAHRIHFNSPLQPLAEWPNFWHWKHCLLWGSSLLGSQRWSTQPILTPCLIAAVTWFEQSVMTRISFVGFPVALFVIRSTLITFIALLLRTSSFNSVFLNAMMNIFNYKTGFGFGFWQSVPCVNRSVWEDML